MAEGGEFGCDDPKLDHDLDHDSDDDKEEEVNRPPPFQPGAASTPHNGGEKHEMQTMQHEQSGLPDTSYLETPLLGDFLDQEEKKTNIEKFKNFLKIKFPRIDLSRLVIGYGEKRANKGHIVVKGPRGVCKKF